MLPISIISLADSRRRAACSDRLSQLGLSFRFHDAMDGRSLPPGAVEESYSAELNRKRFKRPLSNAEVACYLSHKALWEECVMAKTAIVVLEDDFALSSKFSGFIESLPHRLLLRHVIKLDGRIGREQPLNEISSIKFNSVSIGSFDVIPPFTAGYIIGPEAAKNMLRARQRFYRPVDIDIKHHWEHGVPILGVNPPIVTQRLAVNESLLEDGRNSLKPTSRIQRLFRNIRYQAEFRLMHQMYPQRDKILKDL